MFCFYIIYNILTGITDVFQKKPFKSDINWIHKKDRNILEHVFIIKVICQPSLKNSVNDFYVVPTSCNEHLSLLYTKDGNKICKILYLYMFVLVINIG